MLVGMLYSFTIVLFAVCAVISVADSVVPYVVLPGMLLAFVTTTTTTTIIITIIIIIVIHFPYFAAG
jgi:hypothetical protein